MYETLVSPTRFPAEPSTLNPQPSTLDPQPSTLNPQPSTLNTQPSTLNPQPSTINTQPSTLKPQPSTFNPHLRRYQGSRVPEFSKADISGSPPKTRLKHIFSIVVWLLFGPRRRQKSNDKRLFCMFFQVARQTFRMIFAVLL